jgi:CubicO group peptidase (beta-lactamase class C family)
LARSVKGEDFYDWEKVTALLAAQAPLWTPGTASGYHVYTYGFLIGEVIRRITGKSLGTVFREEIAEPLGADFWIGLPASEDTRVAELIPFVLQPRAADVVLTDVQKISLNDTRTEVPATRTRAWRAAEIPAVNGHAVMPAQSPRSTPSSPTAASPTGSGSCPRPAAARRCNCRSRDRTWL